MTIKEQLNEQQPSSENEQLEAIQENLTSLNDFFPNDNPYIQQLNKLSVAYSDAPSTLNFITTQIEYLKTQVTTTGNEGRRRVATINKKMLHNMEALERNDDNPEDIIGKIA